MTSQYRCPTNWAIQPTGSWSLCEFVMLYFPSQIRFPIGWQRVTCHGSKLTNSPGRTKLINNNLNFRFARDQVVHLETAANLCASPRQEKFFLPSWQLNAFKQELKKKFNSFFGRKPRNLLTRPPTMPWKRWETSAKSKIWVLFPETLNVEGLGEQNSLFP